MSDDTKKALRDAYAAIDRLPNATKQAVEAGTVMRKIRLLLCPETP